MSLAEMVEPSPSYRHLAFRCSIFLVTNCMQPVMIDIIKYNGGAAPGSMLYILPTYYAMLFFYFMLPKGAARNGSDWLKAGFVALTDVAHQAIEKIGLVYAGSAVYMVVGSSSVAWTALLAVPLLGKRLKFGQWMGILLICIGLSFRSALTHKTAGHDEVIGTLFLFGASVLHGLSYVFNEVCLTGTNAIDGPELVFMMGAVNSTILTVYVCVWTLPRWDQLITQNVIAKNGSPVVIVVCFAALLGLAFLRSMTLWYIIKYLGAVSSGVIKGVRAAIVFVASHFLFCHLQESQCLTPVKGLSAFLCVCGVALYSVKTPQPEELSRKLPRSDKRYPQSPCQPLLAAENTIPAYHATEHHK